MELQNAMKMVAQCVISKYDTFVHQQRTC